MYKKLFIPGPTHVREEILQAQTAPMIGHRAKEYSDLQEVVTGKLQKLLYTSQRVYLFASSATGVMEGSIRQASKKRILNTVCGSFSKRWWEITVANGTPCDKLQVASGQAVTVDLVDEALSKGDYDAITLTMNETATGIMNPVKEIAEMIHQKYPDVLILVDAVSCMAGVKIEFDAWGLDVCFAGVQKCFALPPGLTVCAVSDRARQRALEIPNHGYYFAWDAMDSKYDKFQTPATPAISLIYALDKQLDCMFEEGLENRFARHLEMAEYIRDWAHKYFAVYGDQRYLSQTVTNVENTRTINIGDLNKELGKRGAQISNGYGDLKDKCFRIGHMGDLTMADMKWLTEQLNDILGLGN
ncbi:MAG: alanine--glyoxylate aminotransferase family protein [Chloroflexi bacterium]|nr:MAG: alanine--glyoxylate aminotransferase family protein [Chloroflexota bacterium]